MEQYQDLKLNLLSTHLPLEMDESWEKTQNEKFKLQTKQNSLDCKQHPIQAMQQHLERGQQPQLLIPDFLSLIHRVHHYLFKHEDPIKFNEYAEHGGIQVIILRIPQIGPTLSLAESSDYFV